LHSKFGTMSMSYRARVLEVNHRHGVLSVYLVRSSGRSWPKSKSARCTARRIGSLIILCLFSSQIWMAQKRCEPIITSLYCLHRRSSKVCSALPVRLAGRRTDGNMDLPLALSGRKQPPVWANAVSDSVISCKAPWRMQVGQ
jgi:hypothetical protein